jgi:hypothetical protein
MRSRLLGVAVIAFLVMGTIGFASGQRLVAQFSVPYSGHQVIGSCDGFEIWVDWAGLITEMGLYDSQGNLLQGHFVNRIVGESVWYNSTDASKAISGGPGEVESVEFDPATGRYRGAGLGWKVRIPGYGIVFAETGTYVMQCDPYTFANCMLVSNAGFNQFLDGDVAALCNALK